MKDKIVLITGSTDGIGKQTAVELAKSGAIVLVHARNKDRGTTALTSLQQVVPNGKFHLFTGDLANFKEVRSMAAGIAEKYPVLDVLINNAGIYSEDREFSSDSIEMTFQVNHLSHFLLTNLLLENIKKSEQGRIINVSSNVHMSARFSLSNLQGEQHYDGYNAYACSKLENVLFTIHLSRLLKGTLVTANALHPGVIKTKLLKAAMGSSSMGNALIEGVATSVYLAAASEVKAVTGKYFVNKAQREPSALAFDQDLQTKLWEVSSAFTGL
jgi:retinol dehydrogenase 14